MRGCQWPAQGAAAGAQHAMPLLLCDATPPLAPCAAGLPAGASQGLSYGVFALTLFIFGLSIRCGGASAAEIVCARSAVLARHAVPAAAAAAGAAAPLLCLLCAAGTWCGSNHSPRR